MGFMQLDRNDPRFDPSSMVVKIDNDEVEWVSISYGDSTEIEHARAGGTPYVVGDGPGKYTPKDGEIKFHKNWISDYMQVLMSRARQAGARRVSALRFTITISYAEWNMPTITDTLINARLASRDPGGAEGGSAALVMESVALKYTRVKWHGGVDM